MPEPPDRLSQYPLGRLRVRCDHCGREGSYSVARLAVIYGAEVTLVDLLRLLTKRCRWQRRAGTRVPRQYEPRCLAYLPDLITPNSEPFARALRVVRGGRS